MKIITVQSNREKLTVNSQSCRDPVISTDKGIFCRVFSTGVHDLELVKFSLDHNPELLTHLNFHSIFQPGGWDIEM